MFRNKKQITIDALITEKNELIEENKNLQSQCLNLKSELSEKKEEIEHLSSKLSTYADALERLSSIYSPESQVAYEHSNDLKEIWAHWDLSIHQDSEQKQRQQRACAINYTPLSLDAIKGCATFRGTDSDYTTSLITCNCMDFQRHAFPCKHMYRLAYELNLFYLDDVQELPKNYRVLNMASLKKIINRIPKYQYEALYEIFSCDTPLVMQNTTGISKLLETGLLQISPDNETFISSFTKEELLTHMPDGYKKSISKKALIEDIVANHPDVISEFQKFYVALEPSIAISHLRYMATEYLYRLTK